MLQGVSNEQLIPEMPNKKYFKIGEAALLLGVKPHVLRYWETEFPQIRAVKSRAGQRLYRRKDVESLLRVQRLLYKEKFTVDGVRQALNDEPVDEIEDNAVEAKTKLALENIVSAHRKLQDLLASLGD